MSKTPPIHFRAEAIASVSTAEQTDLLIQIVPPKAWVVLWTLYILLGCLVFWGLFGSIPTRVEGPGVLLVEDGSIYSAVSPPGGGRISSIDVKMGDEVQKDQAVAILERPDLSEKVSLTKIYVGQLQKELTDLKSTRDNEITVREQNIAAQKTSLENALANENKNFEEINALLTLKKDNFKKGLVALQDIETTQRDYFASKQSIEKLQVELDQLQTQFADFTEQWRQRIEERELNFLNQQHALDTLQSDLQVSKTVFSPIAGTIISIDTSIGKVVPEGGSIVTIASLGEGLDAVVYMPPNEGQRVKPGMNALVTPTIVEREEYGSMRGKVLSVSSFPEASEAILALLHNEELTEQFVNKGAPTAIRIRVERDPNTFSGYQWTSSKGPQVKILPGMQGDVRITIREQPPFSLIIPAFKKLLGIE